MPTILFDQTALPPGTVDESRDDIVIGVPVTITADGVVGTAVFGVLGTSLPSTAVLTGTGLTRSLTPDVVGRYRLRIVDTDDGSEVLHTFTVKTPFGQSLPAPNERSDESANNVDPDPTTWVNASETNQGASFEGWHPSMVGNLLLLESAVVQGLQSIYDIANIIDVTAARPLLFRGTAALNVSPLQVQIDLGGGFQDVLVVDGAGGGVRIGGSGAPNERLHVNPSGTSVYTSGAERGILITDNVGPRIVLEDPSNVVDRKTMMIRYEIESLSIDSINDDGSAFIVENIISAHRDGSVGINVSGANANDLLHVRVGGTSGFTDAGLPRGILITGSPGPRIVFEDVGETATDRVMAVVYEGQDLQVQALTDTGNFPVLQNIISANRDGNVGLGVSGTNANEKLHVLASGTSGFIGSLANRGILITDDLNPRIVFEDTGEAAGDRVMEMGYQGQAWRLTSLTDTGNLPDVQDIIVANRDGNVSLSAPGATTRILGDLVVEGTRFIADTETVLVADNYIDLNSGYTTPAAQTGGTVVNSLPIATTDTVAGAYTAGAPNPTVVTTGSATFAPGQIIHIPTGDNAGNYEVLSHVGTLLTLRGVGVTVQDFTQNQFESGPGDGAVITRTTLSVWRAGLDGIWEQGVSSTTPFTFVDVVLAGGVTRQDVYDAGQIVNMTFATGDMLTNAVDAVSWAIQKAAVNVIAMDAAGAVNIDPVAGQSFAVRGTEFVVDANGRVGIGAAPTDAAMLEITAAQADQARLLHFNTEREWVFKQDGTGSGTALALQSLNATKNFKIQDSSGNNLAQFTASDTLPQILLGPQSLARVGIGVGVDASAKLEVRSTDKGFLTALNADPTANIPNPAEGLGAFNTALKLPVFFNGTQWQPAATPEVVYVTKESQLPAPVSGEITLENKTYVFYSDTGVQKQIDIANRIKFPDAGGCRITSTGLAEALLNYTGTGDFFTTSDTFTGFVTIDNIFISAPTGTLFNFSGVLPVGSEFFPRVFFYAMGFFNTDTVGSFKNISFNYNIGAFFSCKQGMTFENMFETLISDVRFIDWQNDPGSVMIALKGGQTFPKIAGCIFKVSSNETLFDIRPNLPDADVLVFAANGVTVDGSAFKTGTSGAFTLVGNVSTSGAVIDSVTGTPFGESLFTTNLAHGLSVGQVITHTTFADSNYNGTFTVLEVITTTQYRIHTPFAATGAGLLASDMIEITSTAHGLVEGDAVRITDSTVPAYDNGATVFNEAANTFQINATFSATATGNWNTDSLTQDDKRVEFAGNSGLADSINLGFAEANPASPVATTGFVVDTYQAVVVTGLADNPVSSRFDLTDVTAGIYTFRGNKSITGRLLANIWATKSGSTQDYRFAPSINSAVPVFATANFAPMEVKAAKVQATLGSRVSLSPGDTVQVMTAPDGHTDALTITDFSLDIEG